MSISRTFSMHSSTLNAQKIHPYFGRSVMTEFLYAYDQKHSTTFKDLYKNSRTFQAWNPNFQIPGFQGPVRTLLLQCIQKHIYLLVSDPDQQKLRAQHQQQLYFKNFYFLHHRLLHHRGQQTQGAKRYQSMTSCYICLSGLPAEQNKASILYCATK